MNAKRLFRLVYSASKITFSLLPVLLSFPADAVKDNVVMRGALIANACTLRPEAQLLHMEFSPVADRELYEKKRTRSKALNLHLTGCDPEIAESVSIILKGRGNAELPGLLAIDESSKASGIAIGFETVSGEALTLNKAGKKHTLVPGPNNLSLMAFIAGEPGALSEKKIGLGKFNAVATLLLKYE